MSTPRISRKNMLGGLEATTSIDIATLYLYDISGGSLNKNRIAMNKIAKPSFLVTITSSSWFTVNAVKALI